MSLARRYTRSDPRRRKNGQGTIRVTLVLRWKFPGYVHPITAKAPSTPSRGVDAAPSRFAVVAANTATKYVVTGALARP
jgi:hypothetical protein